MAHGRTICANKVGYGIMLRVLALLCSGKRDCVELFCIFVLAGLVRTPDAGENLNSSTSGA